MKKKINLKLPEFTEKGTLVGEDTCKDNSIQTGIFGEDGSDDFAEKGMIINQQSPHKNTNLKNPLRRKL